MYNSYENVLQLFKLEPLYSHTYSLFFYPVGFLIVRKPTGQYFVFEWLGI